jgi:hypothetical protein
VRGAAFVQAVRISFPFCVMKLIEAPVVLDDDFARAAEEIDAVDATRGRLARIDGVRAGRRGGGWSRIVMHL